VKIQLLGTGGADGVPALYSESRVSRHARQHGGKDIRSRSSALVEDTIKIDFGPDTWHQLTRERLDARDWTAIVFTHSDADHFSVDELQYTLYPFNDYYFAGFQIYGNDQVCRRILERYPEWPFEIIRTRSFESFDHGGVKITPIKANHLEDEDAHNFIFEAAGSRILYGTDTGVWLEPTWEFLQGMVIDALVIECAEGFIDTPYTGHLDLNEMLGVVDRLRRMGSLTSDSNIVTTHHSHAGDATHAELEARLAPHGIVPGYDGMTIET
jgi:phosphoribosyl 1,2-cyclic phosphate phosphodiesterase